MEWPDYLRTLAITFDYPGFYVKEKFEWDRLPKDIKMLIFRYLRDIKQSSFFHQKDLRIVNKEFYSYFYNDKPKSCIHYSLKYHRKFENLSKLLIAKITPNQLKNLDYRDTLFYHLINYYFTLEEQNFTLLYFEHDNYCEPNENTILMIIDYLKSIDIELKDVYLINSLKVLLHSDNIDWIENRFTPQQILDACISIGNCKLFNEICEKYKIKPDFDFLYNALTSDSYNYENLIKLCDEDKYVDLIYKIEGWNCESRYRDNQECIITEIFKLVKNISDKEFCKGLQYLQKYKSFLGNENLFPLFDKNRDKLKPTSVIFFMEKEKFPFDFNFIKDNIFYMEKYMYYIGRVCTKNELLELKNLIGIKITNQRDIYCIYFYIKTRFPEIYEEEFLSGKFSHRNIRSDLLDFTFINKPAIINKIIGLNCYPDFSKINDDELYYIYSIQKGWCDPRDERYIKQCVIHENMKELYRIFECHKNDKDKLIKIINSCFE